VSVITADRILQGRGVDRATLEHAFRNLGLDWSDEFCQPQDEVEQVVATLSPPARVDTGRRHVRPVLSFVVVGVAVVTIGALIRTTINPSPTPGAKGDWENTLKGHINSAMTRFHAGNYEAARQSVNLAVAIAREHNAGSELANAMRLAGDLAAAKGDFDESLGRYELALSIRKAFKEEECVAPILEAKGDVETKSGRFQRAQSSLNESLRRFRMAKDSTGIAMSCRNLGTLNFQTGDLNGADRWFELALSEIRGKGKLDLEMDIKAREALVWASQGKADQARRQVTKCLAHWQKKGHARWIATTHLQLGIVLHSAGRDGSAETHFWQSMIGFQNVDDRAGLAQAKTWLAKISSRQSIAMGR